jgi:hypothetical protein
MLLNRRALPMAALVAAGLLCRVVVAQDAPASETFYVNAETGDAAAPGTKEKPLGGIHETARRVTEGKGSGPTTVVVSEGVHALDRTALSGPRERVAGRRLARSSRPGPVR